MAAAVLQSIPVLAGTEKTGFDFTVYTGDLVSHDSENQLSRYVNEMTMLCKYSTTISYRDYILYTEVCRS